MMTKGSRILVLGAALALGLVYVLPMWRISLEAPQYPEGLGMVIQIDDVVGAKPHDLGNINNLNHYIGMKRIEPDSIPELVYMPFILGALIALGLLTAAVGRRWLLYGWTALFVAVSVVGLVDFWKWEYDYGHNLDQETAIIKIPGMSYQPPLIGSREILNFTAHSWPGSGGWILIMAVATGVGLSAAEVRRSRRGVAAGAAGVEGPLEAQTETDSSTRHTNLPPALVLPFLFASVVSAACGEPQPRALAYGTDSCEHCHMGLAEAGHGGEVLMDTGKAHVFDSVECLAGWLLENEDAERVHSLWVIDFSNPGTLIAASEAYYLQSPTLGSPMGLGLTAFARSEDRDGAANAFGGRPMEWTELRDFVADAWPGGSPVMSGMADPDHAHPRAGA
jgi:copper chaperone NosL